MTASYPFKYRIANNDIVLDTLPIVEVPQLLQIGDCGDVVWIPDLQVSALQLDYTWQEVQCPCAKTPFWQLADMVGI